MGPVIVKAETNYILPACGFTAPADQEFKAWQIGGTEYKVGVLQTKVNRKNEKSPAKFTRPKIGITKQAGEKSHRQPG